MSKQTTTSANRRRENTCSIRTIGKIVNRHTSPKTVVSSGWQLFRVFDIFCCARAWMFWKCLLLKEERIAFLSMTTKLKVQRMSYGNDKKSLPVNGYFLRSQIVVWIEKKSNNNMLWKVMFLLCSIFNTLSWLSLHMLHKSFGVSFWKSIFKKRIKQSC